MKLLDNIQDAKLYRVKTLSDILKETGIPHNKLTIKKYADEGKIKIGKLPNSRRYVVLGSEIKRFVQSYLEDVGVI